MKELMLTGVVRSKLDRLQTGVKKLYVNGLELEYLASKPCIAVVGTRKPSPYGKEMTEAIVADLIRAGVVIVSGLAFGTDAAAHTAAVHGGGETIAVLPSDLLHVYPSSNRRLAEKITEQGCLVSEYADNARPRRDQFLSRNRIIAALSDAVIIPEAAERSGSLNTARHALAMGIPVFALPGRATDPMSRGTHTLIQSGRAHLITSGEDVLRALSLHPSQNSITQADTRDDPLLAAIRAGVSETSLLQQELLIPATDLLMQLTHLELEGCIAQDSMGNWHVR